MVEHNDHLQILMGSHVGEETKRSVSLLKDHQQRRGNDQGRGNSTELTVCHRGLSQCRLKTG